MEKNRTMKLNKTQVAKIELRLHSEHLLGIFRLVLKVNYNICLILHMHLSSLCMVKRKIFL